MKINTEHVGRLLEARLERIHRASNPPRELSSAQSRGDQVAFSPIADDLRAALAAARAAEDTADPRLDELKGQVSAGRYRPPAQSVADAMLRELLG
jgi:flagellar biosynthesis anti-sigma factor FlgM